MYERPTMTWWRNARLVLTAAAVLALGPAQATPVYRGGAAATAHPLASAAAVAMLERGGNAADAAAAAAFTMAVVGPYHSGLGGGGFAVMYERKTQKLTALDFREVAPAQASPERYLEHGPQRALELLRDGPTSVAVPGAVLGYLELQQKHGRLTRAQVLAPAIAAAKAGFVVTPRYREMAAEREACLKTNPEAERLFLAAPLGAELKQPALAKTLEAISKEGAKGFYEGRVASAIEAATQGSVTRADLKAYRVREREPLIGSYRGYRVVTMPPPSAGGLVVLTVLGALERLGPEGLSSRQVPVLHTYAEALRRTYAERSQFLGDPSFVDVPLQRLSSGEHLNELYRSIDQKKATVSSSLSPPTRPLDAGSHTTHISVIDKEGNAVALTTTINYYFGSCVVAPGTGVLLNDEMDDFSIGLPNVYGLVTGAPNFIAPGKVPLSSMSPTLVFQKDAPDEVMLAVGAAGGPRIPTATLQVISNVIDGQLNVEQALSLGRVHHQWLPDELLIERGAVDPATIEKLQAMGHQVKVTSSVLGNAQAVMRTGGFTSAAAEPRAESTPAGQP